MKIGLSRCLGRGVGREAARDAGITLGVEPATEPGARGQLAEARMAAADASRRLRAMTGPAQVVLRWGCPSRTSRGRSIHTGFDPPSIYRPLLLRLPHWE